MTSKHSTQPAELDPGFGTNGKLDIRPPGGFQNNLSKLTINASSDLLIYGDYQRAMPGKIQPGVARLKNDGAIDMRFGDEQDGFTTVPAEMLPLSLNSLEMASDGTFFMTGSAPGQVSLVRYDSDGKYVARWKIAEGQASTSSQLLATEDDKLFVATGGSNGGTLYRRHSDGTADTSFGVEGKTTFLTGSRYLAILNRVRSATTSLFYLGGEMNNDGFILRMKQTGEPDSGFGKEGVYLVAQTGAVNSCRKIHELANGHTLALINSSLNGGSTYLISLTQAGIPDPVFNNGMPLYLPGQAGEDLAIQADGKILAASRGVENGNQLTRYMPDGAPDTEFGPDGTATITFPNEQINPVKSVIVQPDGKIVVAGLWGSITTLLRLMPDLSHSGFRYEL